MKCSITEFSGLIEVANAMSEVIANEDPERAQELEVRLANAHRILHRMIVTAQELQP